MSEDDIEKKAVEEILKEAKRARERAEEHGTFGWNKPKIAAVNKRFLKNTLVSTMRGQMTYRDFKNFDRGDGPATGDRPGSKRKDRSPEKTDDKKKKIPEDSKSADSKDEKYSSQLDKTHRGKVYDTFDYIHLNQTYKSSNFKNSKQTNLEDSTSSEAGEKIKKSELEEKTSDSERPKIELKFKKQLR